MAYNRYRVREKYRRQYTFTRAKAVVGFIVSAIFSITMSSYFDRYGGLIMDDAGSKISDAVDSFAHASPPPQNSFHTE